MPNESIAVFDAFACVTYIVTCQVCGEVMEADDNSLGFSINNHLKEEHPERKLVINFTNPKEK